MPVYFLSHSDSRNFLKRYFNGRTIIGVYWKIERVLTLKGVLIFKTSKLNRKWGLESFGSLFTTMHEKCIWDEAFLPKFNISFQKATFKFLVIRLMLKLLLLYPFFNKKKNEFRFLLKWEKTFWFQRKMKIVVHVNHQ